MERDGTFGSWSLAAAGAAIVGVQVFHPNLLGALRAGGTAAWLAMLLGGILAALLLWPVAAAIAAAPGGNLITLARAGAGLPGSILTALLVGGLLILHAGLILRQTAEMALSAVYAHTPQTFAAVSLLICLLYGAYGGTAAIVRLCRLFLPALLIALGLILAGTVAWGEVRHLLPFWGPGPGPLLWSTLQMPAFYGTLLFLLLAAGQISDRRGLPRAILVISLGTALLFAVTKVVLVMAFPYPYGLQIPFPLHAMARIVSGGRFFQRMEGLWVIIWVFGTGCHLAAVTHAAAVALRDGFGMASHRTAVIPLVTMILTISLFPHDQSEAIDWHVAAAPAALLICFVLPLLLAGLARLRGRKKHGVA